MTIHRDHLFYFGDNLLLLDDLDDALATAGLDPATSGRQLLLRASEASKLEQVLAHGTDRAGYPGNRRWRHDPKIPHDQVILATTLGENQAGETDPRLPSSIKKFEVIDDPLLLIYDREGLDQVRTREYRFREPDSRLASLLAVFEITKLELPRGWFRPEEGRAYRAWAEAATTGPKAHGRIVEVGCWLGRSTSYLANLCRTHGLALYCVDHFDGSSDRFDAGYRERLADTDVPAAFRAHLDRLALTPKPELLRQSSTEAAAQFEPASLDMVFLDASHDEAAVMADIAAWRPRLRPGGLLAGHDYGSRHKGVITAVDAAAEELDAVLVSGPGSLWCLGLP